MRLTSLRIRSRMISVDLGEVGIDQGADTLEPDGEAGLGDRVGHGRRGRGRQQAVSLAPLGATRVSAWPCAITGPRGVANRGSSATGSRPGQLMVELMRTTDLVHLSWAQAMLEAEGIPFLLVDLHVEQRRRQGSAPSRAGCSCRRSRSCTRAGCWTRPRARSRSTTTPDELDRPRTRCSAAASGLLQPRQGYRVAIDPVLLAAAVPARPGESVLDAGPAAERPACACWRACRAARSCGIELQPGARRAGAAQRRVLNGMAVEVVAGDLLEPPAALRGHHVRPCHHQPAFTPRPAAARCPRTRSAAGRTPGDRYRCLDRCLPPAPGAARPADHHPPR